MLIETDILNGVIYRKKIHIESQMDDEFVGTVDRELLSAR